MADDGGKRIDIENASQAITSGLSEPEVISIKAKLED